MVICDRKWGEVETQKSLNSVGKSPFLSSLENVKNVGIKALLYFFFLFTKAHRPFFLFFLSVICGYIILEMFGIVNGAKKRNEKSNLQVCIQNIRDYLI